MIGYIKGTVKQLSIDGSSVLVVNSSGVGYMIKYGYSDSPATGITIELFVYARISDPNIDLWGFQTYSDQLLFEQLLTVSGIGPVSAYTLVTELGADTVAQAVSLGDDKQLRVPGVGKKTSQRIVLEFQDKVEKLLQISGSDEQGQQQSSTRQEIQDAVSALAALGYDRSQVSAYMREHGKKMIDMTTQQIISEYLRQVA